MEEEKYKFPKKEFLIKRDKKNEISFLNEKEKIEKFFRNFKIDIECKKVFSNINSITYVIDLKQKVRVKTIQSYQEDILLYFNAIDVKFIIAIDGTSYLGIQVINIKKETIRLGDVIDSDDIQMNNYRIPLILGRDFSNKNIIEDLSELPHLLIAGTTGVGKSNFLSTIVVDIVYKLEPSQTKLILIDTRKTTFTKFNEIPHLLIPVITEVNETIGTIDYLIQEMNNRYKLFNQEKVDNIDDYNKISIKKIPRIVVIIEDFCDLMMGTNNEIEKYICRLIQMSRASGIHLIISTQRPSTNVITVRIKANIPARIAFKVPSQIDSKTIIDKSGAEELLMYGDILFVKTGLVEPKRIQVPFISDEELYTIINYLKCYNI